MTSKDTKSTVPDSEKKVTESDDREEIATPIGVDEAITETNTVDEDVSSEQTDQLIELRDEEEDEDESSTPIEMETETVESFSDLTLHPALQKAIADLGWKKPTPVQGMCLPATTTGKDVAGFAQTGTGKTGVFLITIANTIKKSKDNGNLKGPKALVLVPTRELAVQIEADATPIFSSLGIRSIAVYGGVDYDKQANAIKDGVDVIVATPGRVKDYYQKKIFDLRYCTQFVCDEADRMFDMGFVEDVEYFLAKLGDRVQKLLFSATTNDKVKELAFEYLDNPQYISVNPESMTPENIEQFAIICESTQKLRVMMGLLREHNPTCSVIFTNTKLVAEWLHYKLTKNGIEAELITGDLPQRKRIALINRIKAGEIKALIATDVASRGLHISDISHVYNFDLPNEPSNYVHRIGRTARAGAKGRAYSLVCEDYGQNLELIRAYLDDKASMTIDWCKEDYLQIEDKAGNPYQDPKFKSSSDKTSSRQGKEQQGGPRSGRKGASAKGQEKGPSSSRKPRGMQGDDNKQSQSEQKRHKGRRKNNHRDNDRRYSQRPDYRKSTRPKRKPRMQKQEKTNTGQQPIQPSSTNSLGGIVKKFVSLMFGRKKK